MKKIIIFASLIYLFLFSGCNQSSTEIKPIVKQTKETNKKMKSKFTENGTSFVNLIIPNSLISKDNILDRVVYKDVNITDPNTDMLYNGKMRFEIDSFGAIIKMSISENMTLEPFNFSDDLIENPYSNNVTSGCSDLVKCVYGKCIKSAESNRGKWADSSVDDAKLDCLVGSIVANLYDASFGWFFGCYYSGC